MTHSALVVTAGYATTELRQRKGVQDTGNTRKSSGDVAARPGDTGKMKGLPRGSKAIDKTF